MLLPSAGKSSESLKLLLFVEFRLSIFNSDRFLWLEFELPFSNSKFLEFVRQDSEREVLSSGFFGCLLFGSFFGDADF